MLSAASSIANQNNPEQIRQMRQRMFMSNQLQASKEARIKREKIQGFYFLFPKQLVLAICVVFF